MGRSTFMQATRIPSMKFTLLLTFAVLPLLPCFTSAARSKADSSDTDSAQKNRYIVQAKSIQAARLSVAQVGGTVLRDLSIIQSVSAVLSARQASRIAEGGNLRLFKDQSLLTADAKTSKASSQQHTSAPIAPPVVLTDGTGVSVAPVQYEPNYPMLVGADLVQQYGITGKGVTIAILDTGIWTGGPDKFGPRILASVDVLNGGMLPVSGDAYGHGTHITSIAAGGASDQDGDFYGIAPQANLVIVRAFDGEGVGSYSDVIAGLNWIVANQQKYKIRVLNLSFGAPPQSNYWDDPLNQAVMAAWKAGIVVVASAGNEGPTPMTIGVPGNVPYVITVGALTDNHTPYDPTDDRLASFSSAGPTFEGFVKPEVVAPGGHMVGTMSYQSYLANIDPGSMTKAQSLFTMSGTSQAAAVTTGVVALMLQAYPTLTPDTVKCRLLRSAQPALTGSGTLAYSVFQQGAGLINAVTALLSSASGCANQGVNISADLAGIQHFGGPANKDATGNFYIMNMAGSIWGGPLAGDGYTWAKGYTGTQGYTWAKGYTWAQGYTWTQGYTWAKSYTWTQGYTWAKGYTWSKSLPWWGNTGVIGPTAAPASIEWWTPNE
jgi:serine protease AprX